MSARTSCEPVAVTAPDIVALEAEIADVVALCGERHPQVLGLQLQLVEQLQARKRDLAALHIAAQALGLDEDTRRAQVTRVSRGRTDSTAGHTAKERRALKREYLGKGWNPQAKRARFSRAGMAGRRGQVQPPRPVRQTVAAETKETLSSKVRALLLDADRADAYANGIAQARFGCERWEWLPYADLRALMLMLAIDAERRGARAALQAIQAGELYDARLSQHAREAGIGERVRERLRARRWAIVDALGRGQLTAAGERELVRTWA